MRLDTDGARNRPCVTCRHTEREGRAPQEWICKHPKAGFTNPYPCPLTGLDRPHEHNHCDLERSSDGHCKYHGLLWEPQGA